MANFHLYNRSLLDMSVIAEPKLFGKWTYEDVHCSDLSLKVRLLYHYYSFIHITGLHRFQELSRRVPSTHRWSLPKEAIPKGHLPHR